MTMPTHPIPAERSIGGARLLYFDPDFHQHRHAGPHCCVCGKKVNPAKPMRRALVVNGGMEAVHADDYAEGWKLPDAELMPIGADCARRIGLEWSTPDAESRA